MEALPCMEWLSDFSLQLKDAKDKNWSAQPGNDINYSLVGGVRCQDGREARGLRFWRR